MTDPALTPGLPPAFRAGGSSSFYDFVSGYAPDLVTARLRLPDAHGGGAVAPTATTIVAGRHTNGIVIGGDRRATMGSTIAHRAIDKVYQADRYSAVGVAGTAGIAMELVRLFQLELEHYEKIEGSLLSLEGKANRLATMVRANLGLAMNGLAVLPLFGGYDHDKAHGRIFSYDVTGGRYEEHDYYAVGSGAVYAKGSLKKRWDRDLDEAAATAVVVEALRDASDDDSATAGPDLVRQILPRVAVVDSEGYRPVADDVLAAIAQQLAAGAALESRGGDQR